MPLLMALVDHEVENSRTKSVFFARLRTMLTLCYLRARYHAIQEQRYAERSTDHFLSQIRLGLPTENIASDPGRDDGDSGSSVSWRAFLSVLTGCNRVRKGPGPSLPESYHRFVENGTTVSLPLGLLGKGLVLMRYDNV